MSLRKLPPIALVIPLALSMQLHSAHAGQDGLEPVLDAHAGHDAGQHDPHAHHHAAASGLERSLATYTIPAVTLIDQDGQRVDLDALLAEDMPVMVNFIFTTCTAICPAMSATFASVQTELGDHAGHLRMVSISIDPEYDTPEQLAAYARRFDAGPQWTFLTGTLADSITAQRAFDADRGDKMNHAPLTLFRPAPDAQWVRYEGFATAQQLVEEFHTAVRH